MPSNRDTKPIQRKVSHIIERLLAFVGAIAALIGLVSGGIAIFEHLQRSSEAADLEAAWVSGGNARTVASGERLSGSLVISKFAVPDGVVSVAPGTVIVADVLELGPKASIRGTEAFIFARFLTGGRIDFSGRPGQQPGEAGAAGGRIHLIVANTRGSAVDVSGGAGAHGKPGKRGQDGRDGRCDGFGRYRGADRGADGEAGGPGGNGGAAGVAVVLTASVGPTASNANGGTAGRGGAGGAPGQGGRGCVGLGGSQPNASPGVPGANGDDGKRGPDSSVVCRALPVAELRRSAAMVAQSPERAADEVARLGRLPSASCLQ